MATTSPTHPGFAPPSKLFIALRVNHLLRLWHLTSLDAPTVAVSWALAFAWAAGIHLPLWLPVVLALAAWSFYISDRLLDARRVQHARAAILLPSALRPRHHFHWDHRRIFLPASIVSGLTGAAIVLHSMPPAARERNSVLAAVALAYFTTVHSPWHPRLPRLGSNLRLKLPKELLVAIIFTLACAVPTIGRLPGPGLTAPRLLLIAPVSAFVALAWLNCQSIETWESEAASTPILKLALSLTAVLLTTAVVLSSREPRIAGLLATAAVSAALLGLLDRLRRRLQPTTLRAAADLVLLTPLVLLAFSTTHP